MHSHQCVLAAAAVMAGDEALADDPVPDPEGLHVRPDLDDGARPLLAGDNREADLVC